MTGSTIIHASDPGALERIELEGADALGELVHIDMAVMATLDFEVLCRSEGVKWTRGDPVIFDEEAGFGLFGITKEGLECVLDSSKVFPPEQQADIASLRAFVSENGYSDIYEYTTF
jgi:hypothetical protein